MRYYASDGTLFRRQSGLPDVWTGTAWVRFRGTDWLEAEEIAEATARQGWPAAFAAATA